MKIYFAGSIRGGRDDAVLYRQIIALLMEYGDVLTELMEYGDVLTEHVGDASLTSTGEDGPSDEVIYERDMAWLAEADVVIAEVTTPSHGVGYEVARAEALGKPVLCLHRRTAGRWLSPGGGFRPCWPAIPRCGARPTTAWRNSGLSWNSSCAVEQVPRSGVTPCPPISSRTGCRTGHRRA